MLLSVLPIYIIHTLTNSNEGAADENVQAKMEKLEKAMNPEEILAMDTLLSKQLVDCLVTLLAEVPLL